MHLFSEKDKATNDKSSEMSNTRVDVHLRRQLPLTAKPPRLRLGIRGLSSQQQHSRRLQQQHDHSSLVSNYSNNSQGSSISATAGTSSGHVKKGYYSQSKNCSENLQGTVSNSNRPLIHHQRHNLKNRFQLLKTLGEGTYGKVKLAADKATGEHVAIKYIKKAKIEDENDLIRIRREIQILSSLRHKHIVNIREVFEKKDKIVLVLDYAQGGELYDYLNRMGKLNEVEARRIFRQIVSAIHYCHLNGIVHRDLKLENIILDDKGNVKIADFGLSNFYSHNSTLKTFCGSPLYASPEIVNGKPYHGPEVDVWSLGVILYTLVYGSMPFESNNLISLKQQISDGDYSQPSKLSDAAGLIRHMLTVTPSRRATMEDTLRHWWINFGHSHMPNDMPYSPDDEPPGMLYCVQANKSSLTSPLDPPQVIHTRNQSSISSDSDLELDFRPNRWSRRTVTLDSTGNSVSSSVAGSPDPTPVNYRHSAHDNSKDDPAAIASGLLKLPPDVLEILRGCSSKSLAALLNKDRISSGFDLDPNGNSNNTSCQTNEEECLEENAGSDKSSTSVFDSERKPKRGILKRKGKFSGHDSGCVLPEEMTGRSEDNAIPKSGHLPRRLPSFRDEAHGIFASKHQASQLLEHASDGLIHESCSSTWSYPSSLLPKQTSQHQTHSFKSKTETPHDKTFQQTLDPSESEHSMITSVTTSLCNGQAPLEPAAMQIKEDQNDSAQTLSGNGAYDSNQDTYNSIKDTFYSSRDTYDSSKYTIDSGKDTCETSKEPVKVIYRPKSILKKSSFDEGRNRLSVSSIGSNSSADILDLSYDSGDSEHYVNQGTEHSLHAEVSSGVGTEPMDNTKASGQRSFSFDGLVSLQINDTSPGLSLEARQHLPSHEDDQLVIDV